MHNPPPPGFSPIFEVIQTLPRCPDFDTHFVARCALYPEHQDEASRELLKILTQLEWLKQLFIVKKESELAFLEHYAATEPVEANTLLNSLRPYYVAPEGETMSLMEERAATEAERCRATLPAWMLFLKKEDTDLMGYVFEIHAHLESQGKTFSALLPKGLAPKPADAFAFNALAGIVRGMAEEGVAEGKDDGVSDGEVRVGLDASVVDRLDGAGERPDSALGL